MKIQRCKGMRDLSPQETSKFCRITEVFRESCLKRGYGEVKTPTLEYLHLFTSAGTLTPSMLGKVYSFLDWDGWSGERVVLKPDATIPVARLYIEQMADQKLARLFYLTNVFIFEETGKKTREKWQCGAELIGVSSALADVELIELALEVLSQLGLKDVELRLSHAGLTRGLINQLGLSAEEQNRIFDQILDGDITALYQIKSQKPEIAPLLELQGKSSGFMKNLAAVIDTPALKPQLNDFISIGNILETLGYEYKIDMASVRGFEYYSGVIFQLFVDEEKVGGGGRYDALISAMGGKDTPASGFALYLDLLMNLIKEKNLNQTQRILVRVEPEALKTGFEICRVLREEGYIAEFRLAEDTSARWALDVRSQVPTLTLIDRVTQKKFELGNTTEVLALLKCAKTL